MTRTVPGLLNYALLARKHAPHDIAGQRAAAQDMAQRGLQPADIAAALAISAAAVRALLTASPIESQQLHSDAWSQRGEPR